MDPIAHTLFGATLAETGLRRTSRYAPATLIAGANLPDIDAVATVLGEDASLWLRRGWTHGVLAMVFLPLALVGIIWAWDRWRGHLRDDGPDFDLKWIVILSYLSTWSHPALDFMNTYGVRLLMPFDGTWFYGDTLFIIDPWFWLLTAAGVVLARSSSRKAIVGWSVLAGLASALIVLAPIVPLAVKVGWLLGVTVIALLRWREPGDRTRRIVARTGLTTLIVYIAMIYGFARFTENSMRDAAAEPPQDVFVSPAPGVPFAHDRTVTVYADRYVLTEAHADPVVIPREEPDEVVQAALDSDAIKGFANWTRYPIWDVEETDAGWIVTFRDLRYVSPDGEPRGIGFAQVELDSDLEVVNSRSRPETLDNEGDPAR